ncbi:hypothetical protein CL645_00790 [bacterium]|nr:hypothetical protein [bacterium]|tara:strand:+ start:2174 stop:2878 length:705 start_codon:yes stop_codon:yes gene_type:complete
MVENKTVLITGAAKRIGAEIAKFLKSEGMNVIIHYNSSKQEAISLRDAHGIKIAYCDFKNTDSIRDFFQLCERKFGSIDIVIHNASYFQNGNLKNTNINEWENHINVNLTAPFILNQLLLESMQETEKLLIGLIDRRALKPGKQHLAYTVSEAGLVSMFDVISNSGIGMRTGLVVLGPILPPSSGTIQDFKDQISKAPGNRAGTFDEINNAIMNVIKSKQDKQRFNVACKISWS